MDRSSWLRRNIPAGRPARLSVTVRLAATAVGLLAAGAGIIVVAAVLATRSHLTRQAEQQLRGYAAQLTSRSFQLTPFSRPVPGPPELSDLAVAGTGGLSIEVRGASGQLVMQADLGHVAGPGALVAVAPVQAGPGEASPGQSPAQRGPAQRGPAHASGGSVSITVPIRYRAHRIPYAYNPEDFGLDISRPGGAGAPGTLVLSLSLARVGQATSRLAVIALAVSGAVILAAGCLAAGMIRAALRPLTWLGRRAEAVTAGGPDPGAPGAGTSGPHALPASPPDRTGQVAPAVTALLIALERAQAPAVSAGAGGRQATEQRRQAITAACGELRTPLSVLSGLAEYYRHRDPLSPADCDRLLGRVEDEIARIGAIIDARLRPGQDEPGPPDQLD